jgi:hypothetical protein
MNIFVCNDEEAKMAWLHNHNYFCRARVEPTCPLGFYSGAHSSCIPYTNLTCPLGFYSAIPLSDTVLSTLHKGPKLNMLHIV